jgi:hypothetical protein
MTVYLVMTLACLCRIEREIMCELVEKEDADYRISNCVSRHREIARGHSRESKPDLQNKPENIPFFFRLSMRPVSAFVIRPSSGSFYKCKILSFTNCLKHAIYLFH